MLESKKIESESATLFIEDGILHIIFKDDIDAQLHHVKRNLEIRRELQKYKKMLVFSDVTGIWNISEEARKFVADKNVTDFNIAMAILTGSLTTRLMGNFFININKPQSPTKLFKSKEKALEWLESFRE